MTETVIFKTFKYLNLSVVTDSHDGDRGFEWIVRVPWLELDYGFCSPHQACHCALVLQEFFFLLLSNRENGF